MFFVSPDDDLMSVEVSLTGTVSTSMPLALFRLSNILLDEYDVQPDRKRFLVVDFQGSEADAPITVVLNWWVELEK